MKVTSTHHLKSVCNKLSANKSCEISGKSSDYRVGISTLMNNIFYILFSKIETSVEQNIILYVALTEFRQFIIL